MKLIIISNRLPVKVERDASNSIRFVRSEGGVTTGLDSMTTHMEKHWIGWPGTYAQSAEEEQLIQEHLQALHFHPVFLAQQEIADYYEGYSNSILWPLCHYFYTYVEYEEQYWQCYQKVNELFAQKAASIISPGDIVWIQDYQLMLLPLMIRQRVENVSIGYFHHIPFPSYELFRVLPERAQLLEGLLGADLIGFHTHDYMRHFVSTCERVLELRFKLEKVFRNNHYTCVDTFPMGINFKLYHQATRHPEIIRKTQELEAKFGKRKVILSVDRLDYSKGILHRLKGFARFLEHHPEYHEQISLAMIVVPSRSNVERYADLKTKIDETIGTINGKYSNIHWTPVYYFYHSFNFEELVAFFNIADIALVTPLRDGMNLVAKEYIASKRNKAGVLILSEMAGASIELSEALIINPNNIVEIEMALIKAIQMPVDQQVNRLNRMQDIIARKTVRQWADEFVKELIDIKRKSELFYSERIDLQTKLKIRTDYRNCTNRLLLLDYDGTLSPFKSKPEEAHPSEDIYLTLLQLMKDPKNKVFINSGRDKDTLQKWFGHLQIDMIAEHGAYIRENGKWNDYAAIEKPWNEEIVTIMHTFIEKTPRSQFEEKKTSLVWHYRNVDTWLATLREQQLVEALISPCSRLGLQIMRGNKIVEVKSPLHTKGAVAGHLLQKDSKHDFILAMGDDTTDEDMFRVLPHEAYTIKIGNISETARFNMKSQSMVLPFLQYISEESGANEIG